MDWKVQAPLMIETPSGDLVKIGSWSLSGLVWPDDTPECPKTGTLSVPFQGVDIRFPVRLKRDEQANLVILEGLSGRQRQTLSLFYRSLLSGRMASSEEVITSLDTPLDLVPMEQTEAEQAEQPVKFIPRPIRVVFNIMSYLAVATMVVGVVGNNIFTNLDKIDIQHGRVMAPMSQAFSARDGYVESIEAELGQQVSEGELLFRLRDPEAVARLEKIEAEADVADKAHAAVTKAISELKQLRGSNNISIRMAVASTHYSAFLSGAGFDDMRRQWLALRDKDPAAADAFDPLNIVIALLETEAAERLSVVEGLQAARRAQIDLIERNHVRAPSDGVLHDLQVQEGEPFLAREDALLFETAEPRVMIGWVSERFAETIYIGMPATIGLNEGGEKVEMVGAVSDVRAGDNPERPGEFGIIVTVTATELSAAETKAVLRIGAPVNLDAKRQIGARLKSWALEKLGHDE
ncbi:MAG: HlyD family efflux transporter periplasmic adaptor subunit [Pseudomonadota bacterium]